MSHDTDKQDSKERLQLLFDNMLNGFALQEIITDDNGNPVDFRYLEANPAFQTQSGLPVPDIIGKTIKEVLPDVEQYWIDIYGKVALTGEPIQFRQYAKPLDKHFNVFAFSPKPGQFAIVFNDISDLKEYEESLIEATEEAQRANKTKDTFLAHMSHELRTPLNGILGYAQILKNDSTLTALQKTGLQVIERSGNLLLDLINEILDFSKISAEKTKLEPKHIHFKDFLRDVVGVVQFRRRSNDVDFKFEPAKDLPDVVIVDPNRLSQVLFNLLSNALKFTSKGSVTFKTTYQDNHARFEVIDTGIGIQEDQLEEIFKPFTQLSSKSSQHGTGLGLSIAQKLVGLMGGTIQVESKPGQGSRFWFDIPLKTGDLSKIEQLEDTLNIAGYKGSRRKILIVDDQVDNRMILINLLKPLGFSTLEATGGEQAIELARKHCPDVIMMDLIMPKVDGFAAAQKIRSLDRPDVKIIAVSATATFNQEKHTLVDQYFDEFLTIPIDLSKLLNTLQKHLDLTWEFNETSSSAQQNKATVDPSQFKLPSREVLESLLFCANHGDVTALRTQIEAIKSDTPEFTPFADYLMGLVDSFQINNIIQFLKMQVEN